MLGVEFSAEPSLDYEESRFCTNWVATMKTDPDVTKPKGIKHDVGRLYMTTCDLDRFREDDPFVVLDTMSAELGAIAGELLVNRRAAFDEFVTEREGSGLVLLTHLTLAPDYRGAGLGALLVAESIARLCHGWAAVAVRPWPLPTQPAMTQAEEAAASVVLTRMYRRLGFRRKFADVLVCAPGDLAFHRSHARLRKHLGLTQR